MKYIPTNNVITINYGTDGTMEVAHLARHTLIYRGTPVDWHTLCLGYIAYEPTKKLWLAHITEPDNTEHMEEIGTWYDLTGGLR